MKYFSTLAALVTAIPNIMAMTINTPTSVVQCQPQLITWSDGLAPYYLTIIPGGQPSASPIKTFDTQSGTSITWVVDIKAGTQVTFALKDSTGATSYTDSVAIQPNNDSSCLGGGSGNSGNSGNAAGGNSGASPTTQATDANPSVASGGSSSVAGGSSSTSRPAAGAPSAATIRSTSTPSPVSVTAQRTTSAAAPAGSGSSSSSTTGSNASGAESRFSLGGYLVAGALGLVGAVVL